MKMHATSPCVNAQGSDEARHHGPRPLQMTAERPRLVLVCVGTRINGKVSLQVATDLPRRRRPVIIDIQPAPTLRFNDVEVVEVAEPDADDYIGTDTLDGLDPAHIGSGLRPTHIDGIIGYVPTVAAVAALGMRGMILAPGEESDDPEDAYDFQSPCAGGACGDEDDLDESDDDLSPEEVERFIRDARWPILDPRGGQPTDEPALPSDDDEDDLTDEPISYWPTDAALALMRRGYQGG